MDAKKRQKSKCFSCKHFYNTWNPTVPYGCRAYRFKSKTLPSIAVLTNSGTECQGYEENKRKALAKASSYE